MSEQGTTVPGHEEKTTFPSGLNNAFRFATFNALSYQIVLGSPIVLYAKTLGASATILGIIAGMMPLLVIFQIPAANHINRIGYKRFVLTGWSIRVMFIFGLVLVPITGAFLDARNQLALLLVLSFCFNLSRGISSSAWLPWITALVPPAIRGKYLLRDAAVQNLGSFITFLVAAALLSGQTKPWQFSALFAFSAIMGAMSLNFLKRIPDVPIEDPVRTSTTQVPWLAMLRHPPFLKMMRAVIGWSVAFGGMSAFTVAFLRAQTGMSEGRILLVTSVAFIGGLSSLGFLGHRLDKLGSKPVLIFACAAWMAVLGGWILLSGRVLDDFLLPVLLLQFLMGLLAALVSMANNRLAMAVIPVMGRNHFFALYSVLANVTLGLSPIAWGLMIDAVGARSGVWLGVEWNRFTIFFAGAIVAFIVTLFLARKIEEPEAAGMEELLREVLIQSPQRVWLRFWPRG